MASRKPTRTFYQIKLYQKSDVGDKFVKLVVTVGAIESTPPPKKNKNKTKQKDNTHAATEFHIQEESQASPSFWSLNLWLTDGKKSLCKSSSAREAQKKLQKWQKCYSFLFSHHESPHSVYHSEWLVIYRHQFQVQETYQHFTSEFHVSLGHDGIRVSIIFKPSATNCGVTSLDSLSTKCYLQRKLKPNVT